jgi:hypothetical protein
MAQSFGCAILFSRYVMFPVKTRAGVTTSGCDVAEPRADGNGKNISHVDLANDL